nr:DUF4968 domain-containing protein [Prolixibacteraceae bacterium]
MRLIILFIISFFMVCCQPKTVKNFAKEENRVVVNTANGSLAIYPVADNAVRVKFFEGDEKPVPEFVFTKEYQVPEFEVSESGKSITVSLPKMDVDVNRKTGYLTYFDNTGKIILSEKVGSRMLKPDSVMGEPCYFVEQSFESPADEAIFGLGQFQDGNYNL